MHARAGVLATAQIVAAIFTFAVSSPHAVRADAVVGTGTPASCTEGALGAALRAGGNVTFNCGGRRTIGVGDGWNISPDTTIDGGSLITISGGNPSFQVNTGVNFTVQNLTIADGTGINNAGTLTVTNSTFSGNNAGNVGVGGAIWNSGTLTVTSSTFTSNRAVAGGAISNSGTLTVTNSTFASNSAGSGGAVYSDRAGTVTVINSTFASNSASHGGAVYNNGGTVTLTNTIAANSTVSGNCVGAIIDGGNNLDSDGTCGVGPTTNPMLDPAGLANNGGTTRTIALQAGSPAVNGGDEPICSAPPVSNLDQRGYIRPGTGVTNCSIGAYEYNALPLPVCCQCPASCAAPINGSCGGCTVVLDATCESGDLCVLNPPTPTPMNTWTPMNTLTPTHTPTHTLPPPSRTPTPTATNTAAATDCCQCASFCSAPIAGTCGGCAVVFGGSCTGGTQCISPTPTQTVTASATFTVTATPTLTRTRTLTFTPTNTPTNTNTPTPTPTRTFTPTPTPTNTNTPTNTPTNTRTNTPTQTPTMTRVATITRTPTQTVTPVATFTLTPTPTHTPTPTLSPTSTPRPCVGDCNGDAQVTVNELITMVNIALGNSPVSACAAGDANGDGAITINEIIAAVNNALNGCRAV